MRTSQNLRNLPQTSSGSRTETLSGLSPLSQHNTVEKKMCHRSDLVPPSTDTCCSISGMFKVKLIYCEMLKKQDLQLYGTPP